ncbi:MAG: hypothetical protein KDK36_07060, partial [Leptospiraceae bacterium]|nr:hypothetical protein [Leptospiraceae bacterium]
MVDIKYIEKIPEVVRELVREGLGSALKKGKFGRIEVDYFQIETFLSGGKTGAVVFLARFGKSLAVKKRAKKKAIKSDSNQESTFIRVLKIATR